MSEVPTPDATTPTPKKPLWKKWWFWVIVVLVLGAIGSGASGGSTSTATAPDAASVASEPAPAESPATTDPAEEAAQEDAAASPEPAAAPVEKKWTTVATLKGKANKRSKVFKLTGADETRLKYSVKGGSSVVCGIYVVPKGTDLKTDGGIPEVMVSDAGKDTTYLSSPEGEYFLEVTSANCSWKVTIEEKR